MIKGIKKGNWTLNTSSEIVKDISLYISQIKSQLNNPPTIKSQSLIVGPRLLNILLNKIKIEKVKK